MLLGTHYRSLDDKKRLVMPAEFRSLLGEPLILTVGQERCIFGFSEQEFERIAARLAEAPITDRRVRDFVRVLYAEAHRLSLDSQGRVKIPFNLLKYADLDNDCAIVGALSRVEIWDRARWTDYYTEAEAAYSELADEVWPGL